MFNQLAKWIQMYLADNNIDWDVIDNGNMTHIMFSKGYKHWEMDTPKKYMINPDDYTVYWFSLLRLAVNIVG